MTAKQTFSNSAKAPKNIAPAGIPKDEIIAKIEKHKMPPGFSTALSIAVDSLCFKKGWNAEDYIKHCLTVSDPTNPDLSEDEIIVGILHDVVEDTDWELDDLRRVGFSKKIVDAVASVTKKEGEKYFDAVKRASRNPIGRRVKRRDNNHNMQLTRGPFVAGVKQKYLYHISWTYLTAVEKGAIPVNTPLWTFLQMKEYKGLMTAKNYHYIARETSEPVPQAVLMQFGQPRYRHP